MTQQPFSRPGAFDLSALRQPAPSATQGQGAAGAGGATGSYAVTVTEQNFQAVLESSMTAPVMLVFYSAAKMPESLTLADDLQTLSEEFEGRFLLGRIDVDEAAQIAQAMQIPSIPMVALVMDGRPMPLFQQVAPLEELRTALTSVMQQVTAQGVTARHQPRTVAAATDEDVAAEDLVDPRYQPAQDALEAGDIDRAVAEYQKLVDGNPADTEASGGLAMAKVLQRTQGVDLTAARSAAAENPDDVEAQILVADLDLLGGHVDDAFKRLVDLVRRTTDADRDAARNHLLGLFAAVGNDDPRVLKGRQALASALF